MSDECKCGDCGGPSHFSKPYTAECIRSLASRLSAIEDARKRSVESLGFASSYPALSEPPVERVADGWERLDVPGVIPGYKGNMPCADGPCLRLCVYAKGRSRRACEVHAVEMGVFAPAAPAVEPTPMLRACVTTSCISARDHQGPCRRVDGSLIGEPAPAEKPVPLCPCGCGRPEEVVDWPEAVAAVKVEAPRCKDWCGRPLGTVATPSGPKTIWHTGYDAFCSSDCREAGRPLSPAPEPASGADRAPRADMSKVYGGGIPWSQRNPPDAPSRDREATEQALEFCRREMHCAGNSPSCIFHAPQRGTEACTTCQATVDRLAALLRTGAADADRRIADLETELGARAARIDELKSIRYGAQPAQSPAPTGNREAAEEFCRNETVCADDSPSCVVNGLPGATKICPSCEMTIERLAAALNAAEQRGAAKALAKVAALVTFEPTGDDDDTVCAKCHQSILVDDGKEWEDGDICDDCLHDVIEDVRALAALSGDGEAGK